MKKYRLMIIATFIMLFAFPALTYAADGPDVYDVKVSGSTYLNMQPFGYSIGTSFKDDTYVSEVNNNAFANNGFVQYLYGERTLWTKFTARQAYTGWTGNLDYYADIINIKPNLSYVSGGTGLTMDYDLVFVDLAGNELRTYHNPTPNMEYVINLNQIGGFYIRNNNVDPTNAASIRINQIQISGALYNTRTLNLTPSSFTLANLAYKIESPQRARVTWDPLATNYLKNFDVMVDGVLYSTVTTNFVFLDNFTPGKTYDVEIVPRDVTGKTYTGLNKISVVLPPPDTTPPAVPAGVNVIPDRYAATASWLRPSDPDLAGYILYLNGNRVNSTLLTVENFQFTGLNHSTAYTFALAAVDISGNVSAKTPDVAFTTLGLTAPPKDITSLSAITMNAGARLNWTPSTDASSYEVYQDGLKIMDVTSATATIKNLNNGSTYQYYVIAVNSVGKSNPSNVVTVSPTLNSVPNVTIPSNIGGIASAIANWFGSIWLVLAFSIAIPLAFYVANRVKGLFA